MSLSQSRFKYKQNARKTGETLIVETEYGLIEGVKRLSVWKKPFYSFERVPFAMPPIGLLRFRDPLPPEPWEDVRDCTKEAEMPIQWNKVFQQVEGSEDCLYLSIYTTNAHPSKLNPVMVWIYGGGFENGTTGKMSYAPDYFMDKDVVLVHVAYRLSIFGFLSLKDSVFGIPGNAALKDQILALQWIKNNIAAFGGSPYNVTVFGHDAGAVCINFLMMSIKAKDLFHKAILMSGSVFCYWAYQPQNNDWLSRLLSLMGHKKEMQDCEILEYLEHADCREILSKMSKILNSKETRQKIFLPTGPVVEPYVGPNCIIPKDPKFLVANAWGNAIPVIIGGTSLEALSMYPALVKNHCEIDLVGDCEHLVPRELGLDEDSQLCKDYGQLLKRTYFGNNPPTIDSYLKLLSHKAFWSGIRRFYLARIQCAAAATYLYRFDFDSATFNHHRILNCGRHVRGVSHSDVLSYLFYNAIAEDVKPEAPEHKIIKLMTAMCTQFSSNGNPNNQEWYPLHWRPAINKANARIMCLNISNEVSIIDLPENGALNVWDSMYSEKYNNQAFCKNG